VEGKTIKLTVKVDGDTKVEPPARRDDRPKKAIVKAGTEGMVATDSMLWKGNVSRSYMKENL
jgi:hypothetical protein